ncbi:MAG: hypothetical protein AAB152_17065 [Candidatus Coatesbacteria bacterium]
MRRSPYLVAMVAWGLLAVALAGAAWTAVFAYTHGRMTAPLDDVYITLAYARNWAHGLPFRFLAGDPPSTGSTSLLYTWLLVPLAAAAGTHEGILLAGLYLLNATILWGTCLVAWRIASRLMEPWLAHASVLAVALCGHVVWGFFCGLDTGLACLAVLLLWDRWSLVAADRTPRWWVMPGVVSIATALTRPEGGIWTMGAALASFGPASLLRTPRRMLTVMAIVVAAFTAASVFSLAVTGSPVGSSGWAKTAWASPLVPWSAAASGSARYLVDTAKGLWMGSYPSEAEVGTAGNGQSENEVIWAFPPGALLLFVFGCIFLPGGAREVTAVGGAIWSLGWLAAAGLLPVGWHHHRYLIPLFPVFILLSFSGIARVAQAFPEAWRRPLVRGLAGAWIAFELPGLSQSFLFVGHGAESYSAHHRVMAERLANMAEPGAVGATDVGILGYFSGRRVIDLKGLTAPWLFPATSYGWGSLYDVFKRMPAAERPRFLALHPGRADTNAEQLQRAGILHERLSIPHPRLDTWFVLFDIAWGEPGPAPTLRGWKLVDELDCGDPGSEAAHGYRVMARSPGGIPFNSLQVRTDSVLNRVIGDGGWVTSGGEAFDVRATAGRPLLVMMRTFAPRGSAVEVACNGVMLGCVNIAPNPDRFQTILVAEQDGSLVKTRNRMTVSCGWPDSSEFASYHYWILQPAR